MRDQKAHLSCAFLVRQAQPHNSTFILPQTGVIPGEFDWKCRTCLRRATLSHEQGVPSIRKSSPKPPKPNNQVTVRGCNSLSLKLGFQRYKNTTTFWEVFYIYILTHSLFISCHFSELCNTLQQLFPFSITRKCQNQRRFTRFLTNPISN